MPLPMAEDYTESGSSKKAGSRKGEAGSWYSNNIYYFIQKNFPLPPSDSLSYQLNLNFALNSSGAIFVFFLNKVLND